MRNGRMMPPVYPVTIQVMVRWHWMVYALVLWPHWYRHVVLWDGLGTCEAIKVQVTLNLNQAHPTGRITLLTRQVCASAQFCENV